ncbi:MAG: A/G-specific adenine glycosylase [Clostridiales bacterium]|nr:A/G-specific adenine glycosylase [Clostridiales bacterium]
MSNSIFTEQDTARMRQITPGLLEWYHRNARALPWREHPTPYRVWVSEIMLQQTRVEAVRPYFARFMAALPDVASLAAADEALLFKLWEGLGYYSRARNLQKAAKILVKDYGGRLPASHAALLSLPGVGPYTAGAVASIAFGIPAAAVDGNVLRVLSRILCKRENMSAPAVKKEAENLLTAILPAGFPGDFNQAMMELGATVCTPGLPRCRSCPAAAFCLGLEKGCPAELPVKPPKKARKIIERTVPVIWSDQGVLLRRRPGKGLLAGLWEFPALDGRLEPAALKGYVEEWGGQVRQVRRLADSRHIFTHLEWHMRGYGLRTDCFDPPPEWVWASAEALLQEYALPSAYKIYLEEARQLLCAAAAGI